VQLGVLVVGFKERVVSSYGSESNNSISLLDCGLLAVDDNSGVGELNHGEDKLRNNYKW
jgi:hypothetical protein